MLPEACSVSVVVPTRNEAANVEPLAVRLAQALKDLEGGWELLFVDDSDDSTPAAVERLIGLGLPVELLHRPPGARRGGLGGAVQEGFAKVRGTVIVVMDADLQHPPEVVPALVAPVLAGEAALVAGSRYVWAGGDAGLSGPWRHLVSRSCRSLVHLLVPPSRLLQDPLSGLFALQRSLLDGVALRPEGYKNPPGSHGPGAAGAGPQPGFRFCSPPRRELEGDAPPGPGLRQAPRPPGRRRPAPRAPLVRPRVHGQEVLAPPARSRPAAYARCLRPPPSARYSDGQPPWRRAASTSHAGMTTSSRRVSMARTMARAAVAAGMGRGHE